MKRDCAAWQVIEGIEFRSVTVVAYKGKQGECRDHGQAVIYPGPFKAVLDDDEHHFLRGVPTAVCAKSFAIYAREPYAGHFQLLEPVELVDPATAPPFDCTPPATVTTAGPAPMARRAISDLTTSGCPPASSCC